MASVILGVVVVVKVSDSEIWVMHFTSNVSSSGYTLRASSTSGFSDWSADYIYNSGSASCSSTSACYGYYSHVAACAGNSPSSGNCSYDICPKGWRLPTQTEFAALKSSYNTGAKLTASPFYGVYSGSYYDNSFGGGGVQGKYWSSTVWNGVSAYNLFYYSSGSDAESTSSKYIGSAIRCVAKS